MKRTCVLIALCFGFVLAVRTAPAGAHGFAGARFFPATLTIDDPFVADELSLPTVSHIKNPAGGDAPASRETDIAVEFSKIVAPHFGISLNETLIHLEAQGDKPHTNFGNLEVGGKYELLVNAPHEAIVSFGLSAEIGGTGRAAVGADSFSTFTPSLFYGKGFGDLPESLKWLKPVAVTGILGLTFPTRAGTATVTDDGDTAVDRHPNVLQWGFALEYSLPYLQSAVQDVGLPAPFNRLIPVVELNFQSPLNHGGGQTTGTVNPGLIWAGKYLQVGVEAVVPINQQTGHNVGVIGMLHFYLDDLFPKVFGKPLFGGKS
jgi:hypothetical protein